MTAAKLGRNRWMILLACAAWGCGASNNKNNLDTSLADTQDSSGNSADASSGDGEDGGALADTGAGEDKESDAVWPSGKYLSIDEVFALARQQNEDMLLINVSDEEFYELGHIAGSLKIPWDTLAENLDQVDAARHVVLYCRRGVRSEAAYATLMDNDYPKVWVMQGGIEAWTAAGYPVVED